jgi:predicted TPR repeat methyltransferase
MASALAGSQTAAPPRRYVAALFDGYAGHFEAELVETLAYQTPSALANIMLARSADKNLGRGLDLGCGTGLAGVALESHSGYMVGVDVSTAMLQKAQDKGVYEALVHQDMVEFLTTTDLAFDYFVALDVLPYAGDLTPLLSLIKSRNSRNATLTFSTEHRDSGTYFL